jgi:hypothetical protein
MIKKMLAFAGTTTKTYRVIALDVKGEVVATYGSGLTEKEAYAKFLTVENFINFVTVADDDNS